MEFALHVDQNIGWFQISMDHTRSVQEAQPRAHLPAHVLDLLQIQSVL